MGKIYKHVPKFYILAGLALLCPIHFYNHLLFHSITEFLCIAIAFLIFIIAANASEFHSQEGFLIIIGISFGFVGILDFFHLFTYQGIGVFQYDTSDISVKLWIGARYLQAFSMTLAAHYIRQRVNKVIIYPFILATSLLLVSIFHLGIFPSCYNTASGFTFFKIFSEYLVLAIVISGLVIVIRNNKFFSKGILSNVILFYFLTIITELFFVFNPDPNNIPTLFGHLSKLYTFYAVYTVMAQVNLKAPFDKLQQSRKNYYKLIGMLPEGIFLHRDGIIIFANKAALKLFGAKRLDELLNHPLIDLIANESKIQFLNRLQQISIGEEIPIQELKIRSLDGTIIEAEFFTSIYSQKDNTILSILRDVSIYRKANRLEEQLIIEEQKLKETLEYDRLKTNFLSSISHEFKTPLNVILGSIQLMELTSKKSIIEERLNQERHVKIIKQNCYRLLRLINNLIDITKIETGFLKCNLENHNIVQLVDDIVISVYEYTRNKGIKLTFDTDVEEYFMACDADKIERIMLNLISNAIKYTSSGGKILIKFIGHPEHCTIQVKDTGTGIPKEKLGIIFDRFTQVEDRFVRNSEGSGIGLSLVRAFVEMHNGTIWVNSEVNVGSEFNIQLPLAIVNMNKAPLELNTHSKAERIDIEFSDIYA